jgi:hypothetical protein
MSRKPIVTSIAVVMIALASFALFSALSQQPPGAPTAATSLTGFPTIGPPTPDSRPTGTPIPLPPFTPPGTPLPTPDLGPSPTRQPIIPSPVWTPIPAVVTGWTTFTGTSGFSFKYPAGWNLSEDYRPNLPGSPVMISLSNAHGAIERNTTVIPGAMMVQLANVDDQIATPSGGTIIAVGPQQFPGRQFAYGPDNPSVEPQFRVLERAIQVYFSAGQRRWVISASIFPPKEGVDAYAKIFTQILGSVDYAAK